MVQNKLLHCKLDSVQEVVCNFWPTRPCSVLKLHFSLVFFCQQYCMLIYSQLVFKGVVCNSNPIHFLSNSVNMSTWSTSFPFCVCTEKQAAVHTQSWLCKRETNGHQPVHIPRSSNTSALSQLMHRTNYWGVLLTRVWRSSEGRGVFVWLLSHQQAFSRIVDCTFKDIDGVSSSFRLNEKKVVDEYI